MRINGREWGEIWEKQFSLAWSTLGIQTIQAKEVFHEIQSSYLQLEKKNVYECFSRQFPTFLHFI